MQYQQGPGAYATSAAESSVDARSRFLVLTYVHLAAAVAAFVALEIVYFSTPLAGIVAQNVFAAGRGGWLLVMLGFIGVSYVADYWARSSTSAAMQYAGLGLYVAAESVVFIPLLAIAAAYAPDVLPKAALTTAAMFVSLSGFVLVTRRDFSFLRGILFTISIGAVALIALSWIFGFTLGTVFSVAMIVLACGYILYDTSRILHTYRTDQHVSAALALFASLALLFWYVLRLFLSRRR